MKVASRSLPHSFTSNCPWALFILAILKEPPRQPKLPTTSTTRIVLASVLLELLSLLSILHTCLISLRTSTRTEAGQHLVRPVFWRRFHGTWRFPRLGMRRSSYEIFVTRMIWSVLGWRFPRRSIYFQTFAVWKYTKRTESRVGIFSPVFGLEHGE